MIATSAADASGQAETYDLALRDVPVGRALEDLVSMTGISLVYSSDVVMGKRTVCRSEDASAEELLRCVVHGAGLDFYQLSSGTYVVIAEPEELPSYGTLAGEIVDALTGEPVPSAAIELADGSGRVFSNGAGLFLLPRLLPGPHELRISRIGYAPRVLSVEIGAASTQRRSVQLDPLALELDPIVVDGLEHVGGFAGIGSWTASDFASGMPEDGDVSSQARSGLGVSRRPLFADLSVQGSAPGEHMVRLDGAPVFDPVALGRTRSAFSPLALRRITVHKAGFGVDEGSFAGGVIDVEHRVEDPMGEGGLTVHADPLSVTGGVSLPVTALGGEGWVMASVRGSLWDVYREPALDDALRDWNQVDPVITRRLLGDDGDRPTDALRFDAHRHGSDVGFSDVHAAMRIRYPGFRTLRASFYRGSNRVATELFNSGTDPESGTLDRLMVTRDRYAWSNVLSTVEMDWLVGDRGALRARAWGSEHELDHRYGLVDGEQVGYQPGSASIPEIERELLELLDARPRAGEGNRVREIGAELAGDLAAGDGHFLTGGVELVRVDSRFRLDNGFVLPLQSEVAGWRFAGYVEDRWTLGRHVVLEGGARVTAVGGGDVFVEPRGSVRVDAASDLLGPWSLQLAGGLYRQFVDQFELTSVGPSALVPEIRFWIPSDGSVEPARARHLALELAARPDPRLELRAEVYRKWMDRVLALDYGALTAAHAGEVVVVDQDRFVGVSRGDAYGAGVRASWEDGRLRVAAGYDRSVSERTFPSRFGDSPQPTPWSEPHRLDSSVRLPVAAGFAIEGESGVVWGRTWGLRRAYYDFLTLHGTDGGPEIGVPGRDPLPTLHQLDLGASWLGRVAGGPLAELRAEVRNVGSRQVLDYSLARVVGEDGSTSYRRLERHLPGASLQLSIRLAF
ncbi:MAG: TonB-dependent receptor [Gemmatimonadota bacterium]|nr:TonB-dependent receptor [Gemmatimonadota bacterium]